MRLWVPTIASETALGKQALSSPQKLQRGLLGYADVLNYQGDAALGCKASRLVQAPESARAGYSDVLAACDAILEKNQTREGGAACYHDADCYAGCDLSAKMCKAPSTRGYFGANPRLARAWRRARGPGRSTRRLADRFALACARAKQAAEEVESWNGWVRARRPSRAPTGPDQGRDETPRPAEAYVRCAVDKMDPVLLGFVKDESGAGQGSSAKDLADALTSAYLAQCKNRCGARLPARRSRRGPV